MISKRLSRVGEFLNKPIHFADIGSDHAYLPCVICSADPDATAIAGEVNEGPFLRAKQTVVEQQLTDQIEVRKGNGLEVINPGEVNQMTIAGMGGKLIASILEEGKEKLIGVNRFILQPNLDANMVRSWLQRHQIALVNEAILEEEGYIYEILVGDQTKSFATLTEKELLFGPYLLKDRHPAFIKKWNREYEKRKRLLQQMKQAAQLPWEKIQQLEHENAMIEEVIFE
ncbi:MULTISPECIES: tRNA (adenine(22)-N(1))-methyltransferase [Gracilibacillus]|uniref:tRNA (adenine(22)-N(1))-methyltransferase n=1 Tax=Gracilibacillus TaxID=74385 RepID=UPI0008242F5C|nr:MULTISPECIES: tRNA (adenine(22)-N(1))-methyltransferase TrmK [Gracilibacillus]